VEIKRACRRLFLLLRQREKGATCKLYFADPNTHLRTYRTPREIPMKIATATRTITATDQPNAFSNVTFGINWFIDTSEFDLNNPNRYIQLIKIGLAFNGATTPTYQGYDITPITSGFGTTTQTYSSLADGKYDAVFLFSNYPAIFNTAYQPFSRSYIYSTFTVANGVVTILDTSFTDGRTPIKAELKPCTPLDVGACLVVAFTSLFVPHESAVRDMVSIVSSSDLPFVQAFYTAFTLNQGYASGETGSVSSSTILTLNIPQADINVPMVSVGAMTSLMGSTAPVFRGIATIALWLGFLAMIIKMVENIINNKLLI